MMSGRVVTNVAAHRVGFSLSHFSTLLISSCCALSALGAEAESSKVPPAPQPEAQPAAAAPAEKNWRVELTPYLWLTGLKGSLATPRRSDDFNASFDDLKDDVTGAFCGLLQVRYQRFVAVAWHDYFNLESSIETGPAFNGGDVGVKEWIRTYEVGYQVIEKIVPTDILIGARTYKITTEQSVNSGILPGSSASQNNSWWDFVVGARASYPLGHGLSLVGYGDVGGLSSGSDLTWQLLGGARWDATRVVSVQLGYRYLSADYSTDDFSFDMAMFGPYMGVGFGF